ncbi:MAG: indolepyruvate ferredoxin oxidoreductase subunit alpha [Coriobacteriales bacterium]|jgi:ferredoxin
MAVKINTDECIACGACADACPVSALTVNEHAEVNEDECIECGACVDTCPVSALSL